MISIAGIRFFIEFSSILVLAFLCIMHEFTDVTWAKQFHFDHPSAKPQQKTNQPASSTFGIEQRSIVSSNDADFHNHNTNNDKRFVRFSPESLNFGHHSIGMPIIKTVYINNDDDEINLQLISISGNTEHFHCSFFEEKIVPPRSNTSFQVVFLARQEGLVNNTLYIHSSAGSFHYLVSAFGEPSPFRVRPLIGARVPLNSSFASLIYIYNPFLTPLQLTEMYTSGGGLHLELPNEEYEAASNLWKVPPYESRPVMKAHFLARLASNHTSYIRIRTNQSDIQLMLPVEVEVSNLPGLYSPLDMLDFGVLRASHDPPKTLPIKVINAAHKSVSVQSIVVTPISDGLTVVDFNGPLKLPPQSSNPFYVGKLVLDPSKFSCSGLCLGKVLIKSKNNQYKLTIPFIVRIIQGELYYNNLQSHFFMKNHSHFKEQRVLNVENRFDTPIIVHDVVLPEDSKPYFRLITKQPSILPVGKSFPLLKIEFTPSAQLSHFSTVFRLLTNLSYFDLPLYAYQGKLDLFIPNSVNQSKLDMGLVGLNEQKTSTFVVANNNPVTIRIVYWHCNITGLTIELVGTSQGNISAISQRIGSFLNSSSRSEVRTLEPNHFAVFRVHVNRLSVEGEHNGIISIITAYEQLLVPLTIKVLSGSLSAEPVIIPKSFPGKVVKSLLNIKSNYTSNIKIKGAFIEPKDERFRIKLLDQLIKPDQDNQLQITFDPSAACFQKLCYTALDVEKEVGHLWLLGSGLYSDTAYIDKELYKLLRNQWLMMSESDRNPTVKVRLQIDGFGSFIAPIQAQQHWPRLANKLVILFPSIRVGQRVTKELLVENTADRQVLIQAINVIDYPNSEILLQLISNNIFHQQWAKNDLQAVQSAIWNGHNRSSFSLHNNTIASNSQVQRITEWLGVEPNAHSYIMLLPPGVRHRLAITFNPLDEKNYTSLLILRNNLTIIDVVMLRGEGGRGLLKIGKTLPNTPNSRLVFNFPERALERRCRNLVMSKYDARTINTNSQSQSAIMTSKSVNTLLMRERFKAVNIGRMALQIRSFLIDGMPCEGHGFRISRCEPILLSPNQTFDIEILYSPDFTQHMITHELTIMIDDDLFSAQKFILVANIPENVLQLCLEALPRPIWEPYLYYILVTMACFVLVLSTIVAIFDGKRIVLNYYTPKYEFLNDNNNNDSGGGDKRNNRDKENSGTGNNYCKCDAEANDLSKKYCNGAMANGSLINGKLGLNLSINQHNTKVRNRRGAKQNNGQLNGHVQRKSHIKTTSSVESTKLDLNKPNANLLNYADLNDLCLSETNSWNNLAPSSEFVRQDSSSSENSNRSLSSSENLSLINISKIIQKSNSSSNETKKSSNDSLNEGNLSNNNSGSNSPNANRNLRKIKRDTTKKSLEQIAKPENKNPQPVRKQQTKSITTKVSPISIKNKIDQKKDKLSSKFLNISCTMELPTPSLKYLETKQQERNGNSSNIDHFVPKIRSATLPLNLSNNKPANICEDAFSLEKNISNLEISPKVNTVGKLDPEMLNMELVNLESNKKNTKEQKMEAFRNNNNSENCFSKKMSSDFGSSEQENNSKDIWDSITSFDTEMAMNQLVKQTEEFSAGISNSRIFNSLSPINNQSSSERRQERNLSNQFNNDKWEIGEWSNDFLLERNNKITKPFNNSSIQPSSNSFDNSYELKKHNRFGSTINYPEYRNNLSDSGAGVWFAKPSKMHSINSKNIKFERQQTASPFVSNTLSSLSPSSTTTNTEVLTANSSTFSPIIGPPSTLQQQPNFAPVQHRNEIYFGDNFSTLNSFDNTNKTLLDIGPQINRHYEDSNKTFFKNLDSFLDTTSKANSYTQQQRNNNNSLSCLSATSSVSGLNSDIQNNSMTLGSLLQSEPWNTDTLNEFNSLNSFLTMPNNNNDTTASKLIGSELFCNSHKDSVWSSSSIWPNNSNNVSEATNTFLPISNDFVHNHSMASNSLNKWPISSTSISAVSDSNYNQSNTNQTIGRMWPSYDPFNFSSTEFGNKSITSNANLTTDNKMKSPSNLLESIRLAPERQTGNSNTVSTAFVDNSPLFEIFGQTSPWSPLGSSPDLNDSCAGISITKSSPTSVSNFLTASPTPMTETFRRFSHNSSPASSSSSTGTSTSTNSVVTGGCAGDGCAGGACNEK